MSRRVIQESEDDEPISTDLGPYTPYLSPQGTLLDKGQSEEFIKLIPTEFKPTEHQMLLIIRALRDSDKKIRIKLFKLGKAKAIFGSWWDHALSRLSSDENTKILLELLKFIKVLEDTLKTTGDLKKAKARMEVDLQDMLERTKAKVGKISGMEDVKVQLLAVEKHFKDLYGIEIGASTTSAGTLVAEASRPTEGVSTSTANHDSSFSHAIDRQKAAAEKRYQMLRKANKPRMNVPSNNSQSTETLSNNGNDGWGRRTSVDDGNNNASASPDYGRGLSANAPSQTAPKAALSNSVRVSPCKNNEIMRDNGNPDGWGRRPLSEQSLGPPRSDIQQILLHRGDPNDKRIWGTPLSGRAIPPYPEPNASRNENREPQIKHLSHYRSNNPSNHDNHLYVRDNDAGRKNSYNHAKEESRALSYRSRSLDRQHDDGMSDKMHSLQDRGSSYKCVDDLRRDNNDEYNERSKRNRDNASRGEGSESTRRLCRYYLSTAGCRNGSSCKFSHGGDNEEKPSVKGGGYGYNIESEEARPTKRFKGSNNVDAHSNSIKPSITPPLVAGAGRGRGRGMNLPAWMTNPPEANAGPSGAASADGVVAITNYQPITRTSNDLDSSNIISSLNTVTPNPTSLPLPAGRGRGRGNVDNRPAWMTQAENKQSSTPTAAQVDSADRMGGRFAPPKTAQLNLVLPQPAMGRGRGRGRGTDNRPAWMTKGKS